MSRGVRIGLVLAALVVSSCAVGWWGLLVSPRAHLARIDAEVTARRAALSRRIERPVIGGEALDCDAQDDAVAACAAFVIGTGDRFWDIDAEQILAPDPPPRTSLMGIAIPAVTARTLSSPHTAEAEALLAAARCRWAPRSRTADREDQLRLRGGAIALLSLSRPDPGRCLDASVAILRLVDDVAPDDLGGSDARYPADATADLARDVGIGCAREASAMDLRRAARALRALDAASRPFADAARDRDLRLAQLEVASVRGRTGLGRLINFAREVSWLQRDLDDEAAWDETAVLDEPAQLAAIVSREPLLERATLERSARGRARIRALVVALEVLATSRAAGAPGQPAPLDVPSEVDLRDPVDGLPLVVRRAADQGLDVFGHGSDPAVRDSLLVHVAP